MRIFQFFFLRTLLNFFCFSHRKPVVEPIPVPRVEDIKASPQGSASPGTPTSQDRGAAKRAELRRIEQERRRREAVSFLIFNFFLFER